MRIKSSLVDDTAEALRQMILSGRLRPGQFLSPQKELATQFGVGSSTMHEAIQILVAVGLLQSHAGKGTWVREDSLNNLIPPDAVRARLGELKAGPLCEARSVVEVALTELAARRATPDDLQRLRAALSAMRHSLPDTDAFVMADLEFHTGVADAAHSDLLSEFYHLTRKLLDEVIHQFVSLPGVKEDSIAFQATILEAIEERNPDEARRAAEEHMRYIRRLLEP